MTRWRAVSGGLACVGGALAVAAVATRPLLWTPGSLPRYAGPGAVLADADRDLNIWILAWAARAILMDPAHLFDGNVFFSARNRNTLASSTRPWHSSRSVAGCRAAHLPRRSGARWRSPSRRSPVSTTA